MKQETLSKKRPASVDEASLCYQSFLIVSENDRSPLKKLRPEFEAMFGTQLTARPKSIALMDLLKPDLNLYKANVDRILAHGSIHSGTPSSDWLIIDIAEHLKCAFDALLWLSASIYCKQEYEEVRVKYLARKQMLKIELDELNQTVLNENKKRNARMELFNRIVAMAPKIDSLALQRLLYQYAIKPAPICDQHFSKQQQLRFEGDILGKLVAKMNAKRRGKPSAKGNVNHRREFLLNLTRGIGEYNTYAKMKNREHGKKIRPEHPLSLPELERWAASIIEKACDIKSSVLEDIKNDVKHMKKEIVEGLRIRGRVVK